MMACELFAGLGGFKSMMDLTRAVQEADDVARRDKAGLILQKEILEAQVAHALLVVWLSNLEKELARFEEANRNRDDRPSQ